jgi:ABC-type amino acid transport system permease subunit
MIGDDFGGVISMGPTAALLIALLAGMRLTWRRAIAGLVGAAVLAVGVALLDYARPADSQTHVGRFVGQVLHGGAGRVVHRKFDASLQSFRSIALSVLVLIVIVVVVFARGQVADLLRRIDGLTEAAIALAVLAVLGTFLNDSGVVVGGTVALLAVLTAGAAGLVPARNDGSGGSPP